MAAGWGALIQRGTQWADKGVDWAIYNKQRQQYASQVRHLRRREYQDMVHSMKEAGLNPILAVGATPGHSAAYMGRGIDQSPGIDIAGKYAQTTSAKAAETQATTAARTGNILQDNLMIDRGNALLSGDKISAETAESKQRSLTGAAQQALYEQEAIKAGASAKEIDANRRRIEQETGGRIGGSVTQDPIGYGVNAAQTVGRAMRRGKIQAAEAAEAAASAAATSAEEFRRWLNARQGQR